MTTKRKLYDGILNSLTYLSSAIAVLMLLLVLIFVFSRGLPGVNLRLLTNDYWNKNYAVEFPEQSKESFERPENLAPEIHFSSAYGIGLKDAVDAYKAKQILVEYMDPASPLSEGIIYTAGPDKGKAQGLDLGSNLVNIMLESPDGLINMGTQRDSSAEEVAQGLDQAESIRRIFFQTPGGGIRGSLLATLMVIGVSILIALPIGISAAIYLNEYAKKTKVTKLMRSSIELLAGVPSIIFGLMGVSVLFPITKAVGINTVSVLLGGLTMAVMLLPLIIRQTEESLKVVPDGLRFASLSLGATQTQTIFKVILPSALPGIITATLLSISRIIGESAALIYTMGTFINDAPRIDQGATTLAVQIWSLMSGEQPNFELSSTISIIILVMVLILNLSVKFITYRLNKKWSPS